MSKFNNGIMNLNFKNERVNLKKQDYLGLAFKILGCKVSSFPDNYISESLINRTELFDPEKVNSKEDLPYPWNLVFEEHNRPVRGDCVRFRYRYLHLPFDIVPQYPKVPCKGIFVISDRKVKWYEIGVNDLIHLGDEFTKCHT